EKVYVKSLLEKNSSNSKKEYGEVLEKVRTSFWQLVFDKTKLEEKYEGLKISGTHDGFFSTADEPDIINQINKSGAKVLLVCLGAPKQEKWIYANRHKLHVALCMGVGGALDVFAGNVKRAPKIFIKCNLEWFYRLCKQPSRFGRFLVLPKFMMTVKKENKKNKK
ncbi:MAG: WecB/TagA/CpsF family glycosyltransferase, partial [Oscillospiraceae bacterium]